MASGTIERECRAQVRLPAVPSIDREHDRGSRRIGSWNAEVYRPPARHLLFRPDPKGVEALEWTRGIDVGSAGRPHLTRWWPAPPPRRGAESTSTRTAGRRGRLLANDP